MSEDDEVKDDNKAVDTVMDKLNMIEAL